MLHIWDAVEADFLRDYNIRLVEQLDTMTWRIFLVLLNNLSPHGAVATRIRSMNEEKQNTDNDQDEKDANAFFSSIVSV